MRVRIAGTIVALAGVAAGCSGGSGGGRGAASIGAVASGSGSPRPVTSFTGSAATTSAGTASTTTAAKGPRIEVLPRGIRIDGKTEVLLGGEIQYFRIRDPGFDGPKTWRLWEEALDRFQAAGMTLLTTYVPWDYHEETEGKFDFSGARDLERFLELCWKRKLIVHLKPGPYINSEWPYGVGSFGGCPAWFKTKYPGALARTPNGNAFTTDLIGRAQGRQASFFAPEWRDATKKWFAAVAPFVKRYVVDRPTIAMLQLDNETNFFFKSRLSVDYSSHGLKQYRAWLASKWGTIAALNAAYGTSHASFDVVAPPKEKPKKQQDNLWVQDWFDAGKDGIAEYQLALRGYWEALGVREPDILFTTNDSPHAMPAMDLLLWDGPTKNQAGLAFLDAYPKQMPHTLGKPFDQPFLAPFFSKRFDEANDDYRFAGNAPVKGRACYGAELQGGIFEILGLPVIQVPAATTDHLLLDFLGRGGVAGSIYVFQGGLHRDGSHYDFQAAVGVDGSLRPRYDAIKRWGRFATVHGQALLASEPCEAPVAILVESRLDAPAGDVAGSPAWIQTKEAAGVFGWLEDAGFDPEVVDARRVKKGDLDRFKAVVFVNVDAVHDHVAEALDDYVQRGGLLVNALHAGARDAQWRTGGVSERLLAKGLFSDGTLRSIFENTLIAASNVNVRLPGLAPGVISTGPFMGKWLVRSPAEILARDRTFPFGADGDAVSWRARRGRGQVVFFSTNPGGQFASDAYYDTPRAELDAARDVARWVAAQAGVKPTLDVRGEGRAFARRVDPQQGGGALVFVASRARAAGGVTVSILDLKALGLDAARTYSIEEGLTGASLGRATGAQLAQGTSVTLGPLATAVLRIR